MTAKTEFNAAFHAARSLHEQGQLAEAEQAYKALAADAEHRETVLQALTDLYLQAQQPQQAVEALAALVELQPRNLTYSSRLAVLLQNFGRLDAAIAVYERLLTLEPSLANGYFSLALMYKRAFRYGDAIKCYEKAIELGASDLQEVYSNLGVVYSDMRDAGKARDMYDKALEIDANYGPALFNLAGLHEELGERDAAIAIYDRLLSANPQQWDALARLAQTSKIEDANDPLLARLEKAAAEAAGDPLAQEDLYFAQGRLLDSVASYERAWSAYAKANELSKKRSPAYDASATKQGFDALITQFDEAWIESHRTDADESPIFVCGMFRSGSTLVEQMLGAHPEITAGGELDFLPWLIARHLSPYPQKAGQVSAAELRQIGERYLAHSKALFPNAVNLTDKRPDNFLHIGVIKAMFPKARIVYTKRSRLDVCLSILFQQLGGNLSYATDIESAADYYAQQERLMEHWSACFGDDIFTVDYDELVREPEPILRGLLQYLGVDWDDRCLNFADASGPVKTASIWQVREGLHTASSERWKNYEGIIPGLTSLLAGG